MDTLISFLQFYFLALLCVSGRKTERKGQTTISVDGANIKPIAVSRFRSAVVAIKEKWGESNFGFYKFFIGLN